MEQVSLDIRDTKLTIETGKMAKQASGAVLIRCGDTVVLTTACFSSVADDLDYFPMQVVYIEKYYAAGKIPGGFIKREGKPKDKEILVSRVIDRPLRPLFPEGFKKDVQILPTTISADQENPPDILAIIGASAALCISEIPFNGPVGAVRIGIIDNEYVINPTYKEIEKSKLNLIVAGTKNAITMIEGGGEEVTEEEMMEALKLAHEQIQKIVEIQEELIQKAGKTKIEFEIKEENTELKNEIKTIAYEKLKELIVVPGKIERERSINEFIKETEEKLEEKIEEYPRIVKNTFHDMELEIVRNWILNENRRSDGRDLKEIRPISIEKAVLPRTHGSSLFTRGETQSLGIVTLGTALDQQRFDDIEGESTSHFMLHYNFPPFSVGETGRPGSPGRREIGHGNLAEEAVKKVLPSLDDFPYTIRVVSEILESNGSSSMATVCSTSLSLFDAGVPLKASVAGIAMGLITDYENKSNYKILTDIQGAEDHLGDMDFKVAGTKKGITAFQMDLKIDGISFEIMEEALQQAKEARLNILEQMDKVIAGPNDELSPYAPKIITFTVNTDRIKDIIGPGGKVIRGIQENTGANIEIDDSGTVTIHSKDEESAQFAYDAIQEIVQDIEIGKIYKGTVKKIIRDGVAIEILPGREGLCRMNMLSERRFRRADEIVREGDKILAKVVNIDDRYGKVYLSCRKSDVNPGNR